MTKHDQKSQSKETSARTDEEFVSSLREALGEPTMDDMAQKAFDTRLRQRMRTKSRSVAQRRSLFLIPAVSLMVIALVVFAIPTSEPVQIVEDVWLDTLASVEVSDFGVDSSVYDEGLTSLQDWQDWLDGPDPEAGLDAVLPSDLEALAFFVSTPPEYENREQ